ncbi:MAG TPA: DUF2330 domain-containing protein [Candidatus Bathyarchaeia archaeon]|nr:DUF2330 domain-containing protein [Candidatus Bathyarchaeia archaeon]
MNAQRSWFVVWFILGIAPAVFADGIILAAPAAPPPDMPQQRALIVYRDGVEKLVVESSFRGEGNELAWILPVPSAPIEIAKASAGVFTTLELALQPSVRDTVVGGMFLGTLLIVWGLSMLHYGRFAPFRALLPTLVAAVFLAILLPALGRAGAVRTGTDGMKVIGVKATEVAYVGSYDVQSLEADTSAHLNEWLRTNGYRTFPENGTAIVDDYIRQGWKFVAARLHRETGGFSRPHPLAVSFRVDSPVYPMRLTQLAGSDLHLDLFVIANHQASVDNLKTLYSDGFQTRRSEQYIEELGPDYDFPILKGTTFGVRFGLPSLVEMAGGACVITWLKADLTNAQLNTDLLIANAPSVPTRPTVHTKRGVTLAWWSNMVLSMGIVCAVGSVVYVTRRTRRARVAAAAVSIALAALFITVAKPITFSRLKSVDTLEYSGGLYSFQIEELLKKDSAILIRMNRDEVEQYLRNAFKDQRLINRATGEPPAFEEAPGDVIVGSDEKGIFVRTFQGPFDSELGAPHDIRIAPQPPAPAGAEGEK